MKVVQNNQDVVFVIDFGAQYAQLIARRVRQANVYSEIIPHTITSEELLARKPKAIILSGGPSSVYELNAPKIEKSLIDSGIPVFGICYGFQIMAKLFGGVVEKTSLSEFGRTTVETKTTSLLFKNLPSKQSVWMSHGDAVTQAPKGFKVVANTKGAPIAAFENTERKVAGVQWHPEVIHSEYGQTIIERFLFDIAKCTPNWTSSNIIEESIAEIRERIGKKQVICGLSGGVDSAVAAALVHKAVGSQQTCVFVNHGLLRKNEVNQVEKDFVGATGVTLKIIDADERFLKSLKGISDPEDKRKIIGREFIRVFEQASREITENNEEVEFLVQGTLYPDVVESGGSEGASNIKSHHNVGGLPDDLQFELVEPLRRLFKDEVRSIGMQLGLPREIVERYPFPGPGLAIRIVGEVTKARLDILREADDIVRQEIDRSGLGSDIWQCPVVLLADIRSVGVQGDGRTYGHPIVLRPVSSEDAMTADWSRLPYDLLEKISIRITNEVVGVNRVVLDITSKPPGTIEWE